MKKIIRFGRQKEKTSMKSQTALFPRLARSLNLYLEVHNP